MDDPFFDYIVLYHKKALFSIGNFEPVNTEGAQRFTLSLSKG